MNKLTMQSNAELSNGVKIPLLGFGAAEIASAEKEQVRIIRDAIEVGYRLFDTAVIYHTERGVGRAVRESGIDRDEFFISTKVTNGDGRRGRKAIIQSFEESLRRLETDYVDALLLHWPVQGNLVRTWEAMQDIYYSGRVRAIGLSNVNRRHNMEVMQNCDVIPHMQQDYFNPESMNHYNKLFCEQHDIHFEAFSPLVRGRIADSEVIKGIAQRYGKNSYQIVLRWDIQHGVTTIPRSTVKAHMADNADIFDFELSEEDISAIDSLNVEAPCNWDSDNFNF